MNLTLGTAPNSWGVWFPEDPKQTPWHRFLDEVVAAGYQWIELGPYGYLPTDFPTLRRELDARKLQVCSGCAMVHLEDPETRSGIEKQVLGAGELLAQLNAKFFVLIDDTYSNLFTGEPVKPPVLDQDAWKRLIDTSNEVARMANEKFGLTVVFHPHAETHVEHEDQIEKFLADSDPRLVALCLDTGHHAYRGGNPIEFMRRHHKRIPYLHLKSVDRAIQQKVEAEKIPFANAVGMGMFCEPAKGAVDFAGFCKLLHEINYEGFGIVEQDMYPAPLDKPLPIAKRTRTFLREIGIG